MILIVLCACLQSQIGENKKIAFLEAEWDSPLIKVPGIGPKTAELLKAKGILTLYQLAGVFLTFKSLGVDEQAWCDKMWDYLSSIGMCFAFSFPRDVFEVGIVDLM